MRVLLAGASGAIGGPLVQQLRGAGHEVSGIAIDGTPEPNEGADVLQCRVSATAGDTCPRAGGLDQNIYGDLAP